MLFKVVAVGAGVMDLEKLRDSPVGQLVRITGWDSRFGEQYDYFAYVPDPLPATVELDAATYTAVIDASAALARADQAASLLPNPVLLARPATRREAVSTSALEGTYAVLSDVLEADFLDADQITGSLAEVRNYVTAAERAYELIGQGQSLSIRMLEDLQRELLRGTPSDGPHAGRIRTTQVFIGVGNRRVESARFVPPPADHRLADGLLFWENWAERTRSTVPAMIRIALAHYQFEALHPFHDGNGRLGRLVIALQLLSARASCATRYSTYRHGWNRTGRNTRMACSVYRRPATGIPGCASSRQLSMRRLWR